MTAYEKNLLRELRAKVRKGQLTPSEQAEYRRLMKMLHGPEENKMLAYPDENK